jgi:hypothetical protein
MIRTGFEHANCTTRKYCAATATTGPLQCGAHNSNTANLRTGCCADQVVPTVLAAERMTPLVRGAPFLLFFARNQPSTVSVLYCLKYAFGFLQNRC